jgi:DNA-binding NtrC family response regulator
VRELRNILFIAATHSSSGEIGTGVVEEVFELHTQGKVQPCQSSVRDDPQDATSTLAKPATASLQDVEARHIAGLLETYGGRRKKVALAMGVSERTLYRKLKRYGLT